MIIMMMMLPVIIEISTKLNRATIITNHNDNNDNDNNNNNNNNNNNENKNDHIIIIIIILQMYIHDFNYISLCHTCNIITSL